VDWKSFLSKLRDCPSERLEEQQGVVCSGLEILFIYTSRLSCGTSRRATNIFIKISASVIGNILNRNTIPFSSVNNELLTDMDSKIILKIILLLFLVFLMSFFIDLISPSCEELMTKHIYPEQHNGIVCLKYKDSTNHGSSVMFIFNGKDTTELGIVNSKQSELWNDLAVGDSLYKKGNTYEYIATIKGVKTHYICKCPD
jgi:hypothetical protein